MIDRHLAVTQAYSVPGQTWPSELCWLYDNISRSDSHVEVGVWCGRSLIASCGGMRSGSRVLAVDQDNPKIDNSLISSKWVKSVLTATIEEIEVTNPGVRVSCNMQGSLQVARECFKAGINFDSVFLDGDHSFESISADIAEWKPLIKSGGLLCGHDYCTAFPGVMDAVNLLCDGFQIVPNTRIWFLTV